MFWKLLPLIMVIILTAPYFYNSYKESLIRKKIPGNKDFSEDGTFSE